MTKLGQYAVFIILIGIIGISSMFAQQTGGAGGSSTADIEKMMQAAATPINPDALKTEALPVDNIISPQLYHIGPSDVLAVQILAGASVEYLLSVTPENSILLPRIGEVSLNGKTLSQAKDTIIAIIQKRNSNAVVSVTLRKPRLCYVTIKGNVLSPGMYSFPASMKVSTAIKLANQEGPSGAAATQTSRSKPPISEADKLLFKSSASGLSSFVARNITVLHSDGTSETADLEKAIAMGNAAADPLIRESDEIYVPFEASSNATIAITGAVRSPQIVSYKKGDKASLLLKLSRGASENARANSVFLVQNGERRALKTDANLNLTEPDIELQAGSVIVVEKENQQTGMRQQGIVEVTGNVKLPGSYIVESNVTKLTDVIEQAGGFTNEAYLPLSYILRREREFQTTEQKGNQILQGLQYTDLVPEDTSRFILHNKERRPLVSCDFVAAFNRKSDTDNVVLQDGDVIVVPANPQRVFVYGQVNKPGYLAYTPNKTMEWYIAQAGGFAAGADKSLARIVKGRTKVWSFGGEDNIVQSGDEIYAPPPTQKPIGYELQGYTLLVSAIGAVVSLAGFFYGIYLNSTR
ncbi:MAG: SLBB domain-containing protein [Ignavibacteriae bacterium]|nr:SLBB domain-containing protein [Ignavibacteriota bacterium]